jgi:uncharacterized protein
MPTQIFVNLAVKSVERTRSFYSALGYEFNPQFSNENALCMVVSDTIYVMLLAEPFFQTFIDKTIVNAKKSTEALLCLSCDSREAVDALVAKAVAAGGRTPRPAQDHGFMYGHGYEDPDGHLWELVYMVPNAAPPHP